MKILFTGGGSGGHIFPIIAISRELKKRCAQKIELSYMGPEDEFSSKLFFKESLKTYFILSGKVRRYFNLKSFFQNIVDFFIKIPLGTIQAFLILFFTAPDLIFSKGGYGSFPAVVAGWCLGIPIIMHESDVAPGLANKILSRFSQTVFVSFPLKETEYFPFQKMIFTGNPIRSDLLKINKEIAQKELSIVSTKPIILILGGSQGSFRINSLIFQILPQLIKKFEIIHQTGYADFERAQENIATFIPKELQNHCHLYPFLNELQLKSGLCLAECVISRAGAGIIFEIAAFKKPSILIPLPESAQNHQVKNAYAYAKSGAGIVIEESNLTPNFFLETVLNLYTFGNFEIMSRAAEKLKLQDATNNIVDYLINYFEKK